MGVFKQLISFSIPRAHVYDSEKILRNTVNVLDKWPKFPRVLT